MRLKESWVRELGVVIQSRGQGRQKRGTTGPDDQSRASIRPARLNGLDSDYKE